MKKTLKVLIPICLLIAILFIGFICLANKDKTFYLDNKYYENTNIDELDDKKLKELMDNKASFGVFVYQPMCMTSSDFSEVLKAFQNDKKISFYQIPFSNLGDTELGKNIKYYPSFIIFKEGTMVDFLEADKDEDIKYYRTMEGFEEWFTRYVKLK